MQAIARIFFRFACVCGGLFLAAGCGSGLPDADEAVEQQVLLYGNGAEPKSLDPHLVTGVTENHIISALFEGLINYHPTDDSLPLPGLAARWESNEAASVWTFHLRPEARWSDGEAVTAGDFIYSYERILTAALGAEYAPMLYVIRNAQAFHEGSVTDFREVGVEALDRHTLRISLVGSTPHFLNMLKHYSWFPVREGVIEAFGGRLDRSGLWTRPENFVGNGPFVLDAWKPNQFLRVTRSETYWDAETVRLNAIVYFPVEDDATELRMFNSGRLHYTSTVPTNAIPDLRVNRPDEFRIDPYMGTYFYRLNVSRPPFDDARVRTALNWALDRRQIVDQVTLGDQLPATAMVPPMLAGWASREYVGFDVGKARALLAEAGYPEGRGFPPVDLLYNTSEGHKKIAEAAAAMWQRHLGIRVRLQNKEWKTYLDDQSALNFDIARAGWIADYPDPITFLDLWTTGNGNNNTGWSDVPFDQLIQKAFRSATEEEHFEVLRKAEDRLFEELPIVPVYWYTRVYLIDKRVRNWHPKALDNRPWKHVYLADDD